MKYLLLFLLFHFTSAWGNSVQMENNNPIQNSSINKVKENGEDIISSSIANNNPHSDIIVQQKQDSKDKAVMLYIYPIISSIIVVVLSECFKYIRARKSEKVNMRDMRLRTSNIVLSKRLEVFPKLHVQTDKLGAAIRYYNYKKHSNILVLKNLKNLKKGLNNFYTQLADWDAKYCIFAGDSVTRCIGELRKKLEIEESWVNSNDTTDINKDDLDWIYRNLLELEKALKNEMAIFFTSFEDEAT